MESRGKSLSALVALIFFIMTWADDGRELLHELLLLFAKNFSIDYNSHKCNYKYSENQLGNELAQLDVELLLVLFFILNGLKQKS